MKKGVLLFSLLAVVLLTGAGCKKNIFRGDEAPADAAANVPPPPVKVAWLGPLSGESAEFGTNQKRGVEVAQQVYKLNNVVTLFDDTRCEPDRAAASVKRLLEAESIVAFMGGGCPEATAAAAALASEYGIPFITADDIADGHEGVYSFPLSGDGDVVPFFETSGFVAAYQDSWGVAPEFGAGDGYDEFAVIAMLMNQGHATPEAIIASLKGNGISFTGAYGPVRVSEKGTGRTFSAQ